MGITLFTFGALFAPLHQFASWLARAPVPSHAPRRARPTPQPMAPRSTAARRPGWQLPDRSAAPSRPLRPLRPLRVGRVLEAGRAPARAGRMVSTSRMADVCAELERLSALEPN